MGLDVKDLTRMGKLEGVIHDLCGKGRRNPKHYLDILQAINDGHQVEVVTSGVFFSLRKQLHSFVAYNQWLEANHPNHVIPEAEMAVQQAVEAVAGMDPGSLIFYCHEGDVMLTARLAWEYICSYREKVWKSDQVKFENGQHMRAYSGKPVRPSGFYVMKRPPEDRDAIGKKFQGQPVREVQQKLDGDWGMGCEGIQFVGITHPHYPELMNGEDVPFIDLPGLAISPAADNVFDYAPHLRFDVDVLKLSRSHVSSCRSPYGSGSLQRY